MELLPRHLTPWAQEILEISPILVIEGARQVGKSTLAGLLSQNQAQYVTMDDDLTRGFAHDDPGAFLRSAGTGRLVIDEVQRCPELILPLKAEVDKDRRPGRFVLTGSANLLRLPEAEDSLAGRAMTIRLHPFTQGELHGFSDDWVSAVLNYSAFGERESREDLVARIVRGGYPPVQHLASRMRSAWLTDYANRLLERDSRGLGATQLPVLRRLLRLLAAAPGRELVLEQLAETLGVNRGTVDRYLDILEGLFLIYRLPSWSRNLTSRQIQRAKCYLSDSGLAAALTGLSQAHLLAPHGSDHLGPLVENFVVSELTRQQGWSATRYSISHYRDRNGSEVDLVIETPRGIVGVEIKASSTARTEHFRHLITLRERLGDEFLAGVVLNLGESRTAGDRLIALPLTSLWRR